MDKNKNTKSQNLGNLIHCIPVVPISLFEWFSKGILDFTSIQSLIINFSFQYIRKKL